jgi:hypothetical protein
MLFAFFRGGQFCSKVVEWRIRIFGWEMDTGCGFSSGLNLFSFTFFPFPFPLAQLVDTPQCDATFADLPDV